MEYPSFSRSLADWAEIIRECNIEKGWRKADGTLPDGVTFGDMIALAHSELSEALDAFRVGGLADQTDTERRNGAGQPKPEGVGSELADAVIRIIDMADAYGIDLDAEVSRKMAYNRTRPYRHGNKSL